MTPEDQEVLRLELMQGIAALTLNHKLNQGPSLSYPPEPSWPRGRVFRWTYVGPRKTYMALSFHAK
jgi:hypothetical protein